MSQEQEQEKITPVRPEDHPRMLEVWEASVRATHHFLSEADIAFFRPLVPEAFLQMTELVGVRDEAGEVAGFLGTAEGKIEMLFIDPAWRGKGIGRRLLTHAVEEIGATTIDVNEQNEQAVGFYLRMGFEVEGRSDLDGLGKPFPLLHLRRRNKEAT